MSDQPTNQGPRRIAELQAQFDAERERRTQFQVDRLEDVDGPNWLERGPAWFTRQICFNRGEAKKHAWLLAAGGSPVRIIEIGWVGVEYVMPPAAVVTL